MIKLPDEVAHYFPYTSVRPNQDEFITTINNAVNYRQSVLIEGSNGLGKTISALSACLPVAIRKNLKILYVARTHRQHDRVIEELRAIYKQQHVSGVSVRGRNEMCLNVFAAKGASRIVKRNVVLPIIMIRGHTFAAGMLIIIVFGN